MRFENNIDTDGILIKCNDLTFPGTIGSNALVFFNLTQYNDTRYFCSFGGYYSYVATKSIFCYQITNKTCDDSSTTSDSDLSTWEEMTSIEMKDRLVFDLGVKNVQTITSNTEQSQSLVYIFHPLKLSYSILSRVSQQYIIKYDIISNNLSYINTDMSYASNIEFINFTLSFTNGYPSCICCNENSDTYANYIFALSYVHNTTESVSYSPQRF